MNTRVRKRIFMLCLAIAVLLGNVGISWSADFQKGLAASKRGDYAAALREWTPLAEQGDAQAQTNLGWMYERGHGVPQDEKTAVTWYRRAAEQGFARAQYNLGVMYDERRGVPQNEEIAVMIQGEPIEVLLCGHEESGSK